MSCGVLYVLGLGSPYLSVLHMVARQTVVSIAVHMLNCPAHRGKSLRVVAGRSMIHKSRADASCPD